MQNTTGQRPSIHTSIRVSLFLSLTDGFDNVLKESIRYKWFRKLSKEEFQGPCYHMDVLPLWVFQIHMLHWPAMKKGYVWEWIKRKRTNHRDIKKKRLRGVAWRDKAGIPKYIQSRHTHIYHSEELFGMRWEMQWNVVDSEGSDTKGKLSKCKNRL